MAGTDKLRAGGGGWLKEVEMMFEWLQSMSNGNNMKARVVFLAIKHPTPSVPSHRFL